MKLKRALLAGPLLMISGGWLAAQTPAAQIRIDTNRVIGEVNPHIFGNFAEHLGRCIYGGIFEEGSPLSDADGFRKDVLDAVKPLGVSDPALARRQLRVRLQLDGRHRAARPASRASRPRLGRSGIEPLRHRRIPEILRARRRRAVSLHQRRARHGGRGAPMGGVLQRDASAPTGRSSAPRTGARSRGTSKIWGLGNEIDGPWQLGHKNAEDYAKFALEAAKAMRRARMKRIKLIASGSSNFRPDADWIGWNRTVLDKLKDEIDYISLHTYIGNRDSNFEKFLAASQDLDERIAIVDGLINAARNGQTQAASDLHRVRRVEHRGTARAAVPRSSRSPRRAGGALQLRGRAGHRHVSELVHPPRRCGEDGQPGAIGERDRADLHQRAGTVPADHLLPTGGIRQAARQRFAGLCR